MTHCFISSSEIISSACSMTPLLHIFHEECHVEFWAQDSVPKHKIKGAETASETKLILEATAGPEFSAEEITYL